uniref:AWS domain-containing protein n=1 Tax=Gongylonema pulchrum TaxID=637853 RepID=A0A183EAQ4_9BILA
LQTDISSSEEQERLNEATSADLANGSEVMVGEMEKRREETEQSTKNHTPQSPSDNPDCAVFPIPVLVSRGIRTKAEQSVFDIGGQKNANNAITDASVNFCEVEKTSKEQGEVERPQSSSRRARSLFNVLDNADSAFSVLGSYSCCGIKVSTDQPMNEDNGKKMLDGTIVNVPGTCYEMPKRAEMQWQMKVGAEEQGEVKKSMNEWSKPHQSVSLFKVLGSAGLAFPSSELFSHYEVEMEAERLAGNEQMKQHEEAARDVVEGNREMEDCAEERSKMAKQSESNKPPKSLVSESSCSNLSTSELYYCHGSETECEQRPLNGDSQSEPSSDSANELWLAMCLPRTEAVKVPPVEPSSPSLDPFRMDHAETESNLEAEQQDFSVASSLSSATSPVSIYSFSSTPKTFPSPRIPPLSASDDHKLYSIALSNGSSMETPLSEEITLAAAAANHCVVRCNCQPTAQEIAEGRGCSLGCINRELYTECGSRCPSDSGCANRRFQKKQYAKVETFDAGVKGWGLRALEPIEPGRFIIEYVGEVIDSDEMKRRKKKYGKDPKHVHHYLMALKNGAVIDATLRGNVSRFINHSCDPNCESQKVHMWPSVLALHAVSFVRICLSIFTTFLPVLFHVSQLFRLVA